MTHNSRVRGEKQKKERVLLSFCFRLLCFFCFPSFLLYFIFLLLLCRKFIEHKTQGIRNRQAFSILGSLQTHEPRVVAKSNLQLGSVCKCHHNFAVRRRILVFTCLGFGGRAAVSYFRSSRNCADGKQLDSHCAANVYAPAAIFQVWHFLLCLLSFSFLT